MDPRNDNGLEQPLLGLLAAIFSLILLVTFVVVSIHGGPA